MTCRSKHSSDKTRFRQHGSIPHVTRPISSFASRSTHEMSSPGDALLSSFCVVTCPLVYTAAGGSKTDIAPLSYKLRDLYLPLCTSYRFSLASQRLYQALGLRCRSLTALSRARRSFDVSAATRAVQPVATCRRSPYLRPAIIIVTSF